MREEPLAPMVVGLAIGVILLPMVIMAGTVGPNELVRGLIAYAGLLFYAAGMGLTARSLLHGINGKDPSLFSLMLWLVFSLLLTGQSYFFNNWVVTDFRIETRLLSGLFLVSCLVMLLTLACYLALHHIFAGLVSLADDLGRGLGRRTFQAPTMVAPSPAPHRRPPPVRPFAEPVAPRFATLPTGAGTLTREELVRAMTGGGPVVRLEDHEAIRHFPTPDLALPVRVPRALLPGPVGPKITS